MKDRMMRNMSDEINETIAIETGTGTGEVDYQFDFYVQGAGGMPDIPKGKYVLCITAGISEYGFMTRKEPKVLYVSDLSHVNALIMRLQTEVVKNSIFLPLLILVEIAKKRKHWPIKTGEGNVEGLSEG